VLEYRGTEREARPVVLVGKGVTFDAGGISLKPGQGMDEMKFDMSGAAAVLGVLHAVASLALPLRVVGVMPATENLPDGNAIKPGDIVTSLSGQTIEVLNTDAEGRLILADALCYANTLNAKRLVDVATLTGACHVALGDDCTGAFGNNQELVDKILAASKTTGEMMWQLPLYDSLKEQMKSEVADIKNIGGRYGGAITAALFLREFSGKTPWVHLDIAGTSSTDKEKGYLAKGATGVALRTLVALAQSLAK